LGHSGPRLPLLQLSNTREGGTEFTRKRGTRKFVNLSPRKSVIDSKNNPNNKKNPKKKVRFASDARQKEHREGGGRKLHFAGGPR